MRIATHTHFFFAFLFIAARCIRPEKAVAAAAARIMKAKWNILMNNFPKRLQIGKKSPLNGSLAQCHAERISLSHCHGIYRKLLMNKIVERAQRALIKTDRFARSSFIRTSSRTHTHTHIFLADCQRQHHFGAHVAVALGYASQRINFIRFYLIWMCFLFLLCSRWPPEISASLHSNGDLFNSGIEYVDVWQWQRRLSALTQSA